MASDNTVAIITVLVAGGGAVSAAIIAAVSAGRREQRSLDAENKRLELRLDAERQARLDQFEHEHALRDVEELRGLLDEAAGLAGELHQAVWYLRRSAPEDADTQRGRVFVNLEALIRLNERVATRLGSDSEVGHAMHRLLVASRAHFVGANPDDPEGRVSDEEFEAADKEAMNALREYHDQVRRHVGARLPKTLDG